MDIPHKKELSGKLMTMKFMQRQQEREMRQKLEQDSVRVVTEAHWVLDHKAVEVPKPKFQVEYEPSFLQMEAEVKSNVGRVSFMKFNKNIEKMTSASLGEQQLERELKRERQSEIGEEEMTDKLKESVRAKKPKKDPASNRRQLTPKKTSNSGTSEPQRKGFMKPAE